MSSYVPGSGARLRRWPAALDCVDRGGKSCVDRGRSLMVMGCGLVTAGVTPGKNGDAALLRLVRSWLPARPDWRSWPDQERFRGQKLPGMLTTAARLRVHHDWDVETTTTVIALRSLARRFRALSIEAKEHEKAIRAIIHGWRPDLLEEFGVGAIVAAPC